MDRLTESAIAELEVLCPGGVARDVDLSAISWWRIGGRADLVLRPSSTGEVAALLRWFSAKGIQPVVIGMTTNLLFDDAGLHAPCIQIGGRMAQVVREGQLVQAQAGAWVPGLARKLMQAGLGGAEHICGIPGTLGGLVCMNGGSQRKGISSSILSVESVDLAGRVRYHDVADCGFAYRQSIFQSNGEVITATRMRFAPRPRTEIRSEMRSILADRRRKFPRKEPNCGSVFKSNPAMYAEVGPPGAVIETLGFKGRRVGGALVSPKHANFIVNTGEATARDVLRLIADIGNAVEAATGHRMEAEACFVSADGTIHPAYNSAAEFTETSKLIHFFIGCFKGVNSGNGGHYHSLLTLKKSIECRSKIIVVGDLYPPAYVGEKDVLFLKTSRLGLCFLDDYIKADVMPPQIVHAFDPIAAAYASNIARKRNIPFIITKPGGPKLRSHYLPYRNQIVYHEEDLKHCRSKYFKPDNLEMIPHRVTKPVFNNERPDPFYDNGHNHSIRIICISRIGQYYKHKIKQAINLHTELERRGLNIKLSIVGAIEDQSVLEELQDLSSSPTISFRTSPEFTYRASELLHYADASVGGGRSFMESLSLGKLTFFPVRSSEFPCLAESNNINSAAAMNFSERTKVSRDINPSISLDNFAALIRNDTTAYQNWAAGYFEDHFSATTGAKLHLTFYHSAVSPERLTITVLNLASVTAGALLKMLNTYSIKLSSS